MSTKEEKIREKKNSIIEALKNCLQKDVYSKITVQDVADEAGFSKGGLLYYYPTKEELYMDLMEHLFNEIAEDHINVMRGNLQSEEKASISALYGIEKFVLDRKTTKILINLFLYGYEDEKIMKPMSEFMRRHLKLYEGIVQDARADLPSRRKTDFDAQFIARIAQIIVLSAGLIESVDPIDLDPLKLVRYINSLFRG